MEFPFGIQHSALGVLPRGYEGASAPSGGVAGKSWTSKYGVVGMCAFGDPAVLTDGINEAGVSAHILYMRGDFCTFAEFQGDGKDLAQVNLVSYLLGTCGSIAEVEQAMRDVRVWGVDPGVGTPPTIHVGIHDATGAKVVEFRAEGVNIVDNPSGVMTNAPYLDWHLINLANYVNMNPGNGPDEPAKIGSFTPQILGSGYGMVGSPGDYTTPGRFVRAALQLTFARQPEDATAAELLALHILNTVDMMPGIARESADAAAALGVDPGSLDEVTEWITLANITGKRYLYRTMNNPTVYAIELDTVDFDAPARVVDIEWTTKFEAVTV